MKCVLCKHGTTNPGNVTVTLERDNCIIILKNVSADICENCGEYYLSQSTTKSVLSRAERVVVGRASASPNRNTEIEILRFAA